MQATHRWACGGSSIAGLRPGAGGTPAIPGNDPASAPSRERGHLARFNTPVGLRPAIPRVFGELLSIIGSIVAVGITLDAVVIGSNANVRAEVRTEMQTLRTEVRTDITDVRTEMQTLRAEVRTDIRALEARLAGVERRQARTEGLLEWLRDAITARGGEAPPARKEST